MENLKSFDKFTKTCKDADLNKIKSFLLKINAKKIESIKEINDLYPFKIKGSQVLLFKHFYKKWTNIGYAKFDSENNQQHEDTNSEVLKIIDKKLEDQLSTINCLYVENEEYYNIFVYINL